MNRVKEYRSATHRFKCAALAHDAELLVTGDDNNMLNLWSFSANAPILVGMILSLRITCYARSNTEVLRLMLRVLILVKLNNTYLPVHMPVQL